MTCLCVSLEVAEHPPFIFCQLFSQQYALGLVNRLINGNLFTDEPLQPAVKINPSCHCLQQSECRTCQVLCKGIYPDPSQSVDSNVARRLNVVFGILIHRMFCQCLIRLSVHVDFINRLSEFVLVSSFLDFIRKMPRIRCYSRSLEQKFNIHYI